MLILSTSLAEAALRASGSSPRSSSLRKHTVRRRERKEQKLTKPMIAQATFISVVGNLNKSTASLMKRLSVKAIPCFFICALL